MHGPILRTLHSSDATQSSSLHYLDNFIGFVEPFSSRNMPDQYIREYIRES